MKLFFCFSHRENLKRLEQFFKHYRELGVTNFYGVYHSYEESSRDVISYVMKNSMVVNIWDTPFDDVKKVNYINRAKLKFSNPNEWVFTVDCDEFIDLSKKNLNKIINSNSNYVRFLLIDRLSNPPLKEVTDEDLNITFPIYDYFTYRELGGCAYKIPLSRREVILGLGYHDVTQEDQVILLKKHPLNGFINHYKWIKEIKNEASIRVNTMVTENNEEYKDELVKLVNNNFSNIHNYKAPLKSKLLFIVWSMQDLNVLKQFFKHYSELGVTEFYCIFHTYGMKDNTIYNYVEENAFIVHHWDEPYTTEWEAKLKNKYKREIVDDENEWVWVVDADEFVVMSIDYIRELQDAPKEINYVNGWMVDRFSPDGLIVPKNENIFIQFPIRTFYTRFKLTGSASKVTLTRGYVILGTGHHVVTNRLYDYGLEDERELIPYNPKEENYLEVAHVKWHYQILEEIYQKFTKTMNICQYSAREQGIFVLDYLYKKKPIEEMIKEFIIEGNEGYTLRIHESI